MSSRSVCLQPVLAKIVCVFAVEGRGVHLELFHSCLSIRVQSAVETRGVSFVHLPVTVMLFS